MTIERMLEILSAHEGGKDWGAWNPNDNGRGVSFGRWQFNQMGGLHALLVRMYAADPQRFLFIFGPSTTDLLNVSKLRKMDFNTYEMRNAFVNASRNEVFQQCQVAEVVESYVKPAAKLAIEHVPSTWTWLALLVDVSIQYGVGGCNKKLLQALNNPGIDGLMDTFAALADGKEYNRRFQIIYNQELLLAGDWAWDDQKWGSL